LNYLRFSATQAILLLLNLYFANYLLMKIAFFDSGVGGLSVLQTAIQVLPPQHYIYFADSMNAPYGTKSKKEIKKLMFEAVDFLQTKNIDALVVACNTATSAAIKDLRKAFNFPIIGMEPAIKPAIEKAKNKKVVLFATELTLKEKKLKQLIQKLESKKRVTKIPLQKLVIYGEEMKWNKPEVYNYLEKKLKKIDWKNYSSIVLGCTHFLFFKNQFQKILPPHVEIIDGNLGTILHLQNQIHLPTNRKRNKFEFYISQKKVKRSHFQPYLKVLL